MTTRPTTETQAEALSRALNSGSMMNYAAILHGFIEKGIPAEDIQPRENVFTFNAWKALGRHVKRGEHGIRVLTWITCTETAEDSTEPRTTYRRPKAATVFHISQTEPNEEPQA